MRNPSQRRWLTLLLFCLAFLSLLALGAIKLRHDFLTRGIPQELPQPVAHSQTRLGINIYLEEADEETLNGTLEEIAGLGTTFVKQSFYFQEPFDWSVSDRLVAAVTSQGLELVPLLDGHPANQFAPPDNVAGYAAWAGEFAARYGESLTYYIIWDEPNITSHWGNRPVNAAEYAALLTAAAAAIRAADSNAVIVAAPLAPTVETGPQNLADPLYLKELYEAGAASAFDIAAAKPYGFNTGPEDRAVNIETLNFSRAILLREVMEKYGDGHKAVWAGNWGWNSLPAGWTGSPSIWGQVDEQTQADWTIIAWNRVRREWPWMGTLFLENWRPAAPADDPRWGFSIAGRETAAAIQANQPDRGTAFPAFHLADSDDPAQQYEGGWRFSPEFGADISQTGDSVTFQFWGTEVGVLVRRADFRARLYAVVDGQPANALPRDDQGTMLVLTSPDSAEDAIVTEIIARNLEPGEHTLTLVAHRGWDQWALNGFTASYRPQDKAYTISLAALALFTLAATGLAFYIGRQADWGQAGAAIRRRFEAAQPRRQAALAALVAAVVALTGWLTWGEQAAGLYRRLGDGRLGDGGQLALTAAAASIFYITPFFFVYLAALAVLFLLIYFRPAWGLVLVAFWAPFYRYPKPIGAYRFSPVEMFLLVSLAAFLLSRIVPFLLHLRNKNTASPSFSFSAARLKESMRGLFALDYAVLAFTLVATLSLFFTERLDVATNEWRLMIIEPACFYFLLRFGRLQEREWRTILDAFIFGGLVVALIGLGQVAIQFLFQNSLQFKEMVALLGLEQIVARHSLITAEGGLQRLRSVYGSPNNVALYLGRVLPFLVAMFLMGQGRRRIAYTAALLPVGLAILLTFSKGALFLGIPASMAAVFIIWQRGAGRRSWPWLVGAGLLGGLALLIALQIPQLAGRLNPQGETGFLRLNLWRASLNMFLDHPLIGVGLDNFLYEYRGRYIFDAAWREPDLNHPHNILLDLGTRLGLLGIACGIWLFASCWRILRHLPGRVSESWRPAAVGIIGAMIALLFHGLVDHSFFLIDLAYAFYLLAALALWLHHDKDWFNPRNNSAEWAESKSLGQPET